MKEQTLLYLSTNRITVYLLSAGGVALTGATVVVDLFTMSGALVMRAGDIPLGTLQLEYLDNGGYSAIVPHDLMVVVSQRLIAKVHSVRAGVHRYAELKVKVVLDTD